MEPTALDIPSTPLMHLVAYLASVHLGLLFVGLFLLLLVAKEIGYAIGRHTLAARARRAMEAGADRQKDAVGLITGGMLALAAFLLALAVSMAQGRHDARRDAVRDEANAIGTAWLRADFAGEAAQSIRVLLRDYAAARLAAVVSPPAGDRLAAEVAQTNAVQGRIWALASPVARATHTPDATLLIGSLNQMFDLSLTSRRAFDDRVPIGVLRMLLWATLISMGVVGYNFALAGGRQAIFSALLMAFWSSTLVLIVDMNDPAKGSIRVDPAPLVWAIEGFGPPPR